MRRIHTLFIVVCFLYVVICGCSGTNNSTEISSSGGVIDARVNVDICTVHKISLQEDTVPIRYGLPASTEEYRAARQELFPYANSYYLGGCIVKPERQAIIKYCTECRKAEKDWERKHGKQGLK